jgi:DNA invertase Pin-like site-specific DNA recombinase
MKAVALFRVSTDKQADSALGLEAQKSAVAEFCARQGFELVASHTEAGVSGRKALTARTGLLSAVADVSVLDADVLVVASLDRVSRDPLILMTIEKTLAGKGARLISAKGEGTESDDPSQVLMRRILGAVAEMEASLISARTKASLKAKKARGEITGRAPMGFDLVDGQLQPNNDFDLVLRVMKLRSKKVSFREIAEIMDTFAPDRPWSIVKTQRIVRRWKSLRNLRKQFPAQK